jgi:prepilin-type processing-associated H-X9-DG protein
MQNLSQSNRQATEDEPVKQTNQYWVLLGLRGIAVALASLGTLAVAFSQVLKDEPVLMQARVFRMPSFIVSRISRDGTMILQPSSTTQEALRANVSSLYAEGHYLLLTSDPKQAGRNRLFHVQLMDIADGLVVTVKTGAKASSRVHVDEQATLLRPLEATTARMRALPDEILIEKAPDDGTAQLSAREIAARRQSIVNLKMISLAMHNFHSTYDRFPPAVIYGPDGKPWHSWRVLLLPFLEQAPLYNSYDFSQPWDSPKNKALVDQMPAVYRDPINGDENQSFTNYGALVAPNAIFTPDGGKQVDPKLLPLGKDGIGLRDITDGTSNTLTFAPVEPGRKIPWTKPEDIDAGPAFAGFGQPNGIAAPFTFLGPGGGKAAPFAFADGSVRMIAASINPNVLSALFSRASGEVIAADAIPFEIVRIGGELPRMLTIRTRDRKTTAVIEELQAGTTQRFVPVGKEFRKPVVK